MQTIIFGSDSNLIYAMSRILKLLRIFTDTLMVQNIMKITELHVNKYINRRIESTS